MQVQNLVGSPESPVVDCWVESQQQNCFFYVNKPVTEMPNYEQDCYHKRGENIPKASYMMYVCDELAQKACKGAENQ